ncbi:MAG: acyloxyacyl hydrolase [Bacteroidetes bacterium]|nr:acyloxyacyl hydrolase [Bacteroidota bacterium]
MRSLKNILLVFFLLGTIVGLSQSDSTRSQIAYSLASSFGNVIANADELENNSIAQANGFSAALHWQKTDAVTYNLFACYPRHSLSFTYQQFENKALGGGFIINYSLSPYFLVSNRISLYPSISVGLSALSNPYCLNSNPNNKLYSLPVSAFLALGGGIRWQLTKHLAAQTAVAFNHASNGGWKDPNNGLNWPVLSVGVEYSPSQLLLTKRSRIKPTEQFRRLRVDADIFGLIRSGVITSIERNKPVIGIQLLASKQTTRIHAWTLALEFYQDQLVQEQLKSYSIASDGFRAGAMVGHEFLLGKFVFSQQLGVYLAGRNGAELLYHRWGCKYFLNDRWGVGVNLRAYKAVAEFTDLRVSYSLFKR